MFLKGLLILNAGVIAAGGGFGISKYSLTFSYFVMMMFT
jgi:hypothetical protein